MSISMGVFTFINVWWIALFIVLPFVIHSPPPSKEGEASLPQIRSWKKLLLANTLFSVCITILLAVMIHIGLVPLKTLQ